MLRRKIEALMSAPCNRRRGHGRKGTDPKIQGSSKNPVKSWGSPRCVIKSHGRSASNGRCMVSTRVMHRRASEDRFRKSSALRIETASGFLETHQKGGGLRPPPFLIGFPESTDRFDPKVCKCPRLCPFTPSGATPPRAAKNTSNCMC